VLLGNKIDLFAESEVSPEEAEMFAKEHNFRVFQEVSAKEGIGIADVFSKIADEFEPVVIEKKEVQKL